MRRRYGVKRDQFQCEKRPSGICGGHCQQISPCEGFICYLLLAPWRDDARCRRIRHLFCVLRRNSGKSVPLYICCIVSLCREPFRTLRPFCVLFLRTMQRPFENFLFLHLFCVLRSVVRSRGAGLKVCVCVCVCVCTHTHTHTHTQTHTLTRSHTYTHLLVSIGTEKGDLNMEERVVRRRSRGEGEARGPRAVEGVGNRWEGGERVCGGSGVCVCVFVCVCVWLLFCVSEHMQNYVTSFRSPHAS